MTRCGRIGWRNGTASVALPVLIVLALGARRLPSVFDDGLIDPDSYMRLVRLRETPEQRAASRVAAAMTAGAAHFALWVAAFPVVPRQLAVNPASANILYRIVR
jgi:hypothetical protein